MYFLPEIWFWLWWLFFFLLLLRNILWLYFMNWNQIVSVIYFLFRNFDVFNYWLVSLFKNLNILNFWLLCILSGFCGLSLSSLPFLEFLYFSRVVVIVVWFCRDLPLVRIVKEWILNPLNLVGSWFVVILILTLNRNDWLVSLKLTMSSGGRLVILSLSSKSWSTTITSSSSWFAVGSWS